MQQHSRANVAHIALRSALLRRAGLVLACVLALLSELPQSRAQSGYTASEAQEIYERGVAFEKRAADKNDDDLLEDAAKQYRLALSKDPGFAPAAARLGYVLYALKRSDEAIELLKGVLSRSPDNTELMHYLGINLYQLGREDEAAEYLRRVTDARDDLPEAFFILGKYLIDKENWLEAKPLFERYVQLLPTDPQGFRALSSIHLQLSEWSAAQTVLESLLLLQPKDLVAHINLGHARFGAGDSAGAAAAYSTALQQAPERTDVRYDLASVYYLSEDYDKALSEFDRILEKNPQHFGAAYFRADCLLELRRLDEAELAFEQLLELKPSYLYAYLKLAQIALARGQELDAKNLLQQLQSKPELHPDVLAMAGVLYRQMNDFEAAVDAHQRLVQLDGEQLEARLLLGQDLILAGRPSDAVAQFEEATRIDPMGMSAWHGLSAALLHRAQAELKNGDKSAARATLNQVTELDIHPLAAQLNLAVLDLAERDLESARQHVQQAQVLDPESPQLKRLEAKLLIAEGQSKNATKLLNALRDAEQLDADGWHDLAVALANLGQYSDAEDALSRAIEAGISAPNTEAIIALEAGIEKASQSDWKNAEKLFDKATLNANTLSSVDRCRLEYGLGIATLRNRKLARAEKHLENTRTLFQALSAKERRLVISSGKLVLDLELAYAYYKNGKYDGAADLLSGLSAKGDVALLLQAVLENLALAAIREDKVDSALSTLEKAAKLKSSSSIEFNLAVARYLLGQQTKAAKVFEKFAAQKIPEAVFNYAMYLDDVANQREEALRFFSQYVALGGAKKAEVEKLIEIKHRVFGTEASNAP